MPRQKRTGAPRGRYTTSRGRHRLLFSILTVLVVAVCVVAGSIVFFKVSDIQVEGNVRYTQQQVVDALDISEGDNLFLMNKFQVGDELVAELPYIKAVTIRRSLPGTVRILVTECEPAAAVQCTGGYWFIDEEGQLLEYSSDSQNAPVIIGVSLTSPTAGTDIQVDTENSLKQDSLLGLLQALTDYEMLSGVISVDMTSETQLIMQYTDRFQVKIPYGADYSYKIYTLTGVIDNLTEAESGTIDMTLDEKTFFRQG